MSYYIPECEFLLTARHTVVGLFLLGMRLSVFVANNTWAIHGVETNGVD